MKTKLFFILCLSTLSIKAWASPDILKNRWYAGLRSLYREYTLPDGSREHRTDHYFTAWDTTIGTNSYAPVFWRADGDYKNETLAGYALREDGDRVYVYDYSTQKEHLFFDFSLKENDILAMDWIEETDTRKNPVFRVLAVGDTTMEIREAYTGWRYKWDFRYLKVYDIVHQVTDMWLSEVGSVSHGIAWHKDFGRSLDTIETVLCVGGGETYRNPECPSCYIPQVEPEYVSCKERLIFVQYPVLGLSAPDCLEAAAIEWGELVPFLTVDSRWAFHELLFQGVEYGAGDSIEVEGYIFQRRDLRGAFYSELEVKTGATPVEKRQKSALRIYPNPAHEEITIEAAGCDIQHVEILDVNGRVLYAVTVNGTASFRYNVAWLPSGIYLARVKTPCGVLTEKFSVK